MLWRMPYFAYVICMASMPIHRKGSNWISRTTIVELTICKYLIRKLSVVSKRSEELTKEAVTQ